MPECCKVREQISHLLWPLSLEGKEWHYKGEGNANIVLAVPKDGFVVRVMKDCGLGGKVTRETLTDIARTMWLRNKYNNIVSRTFFNFCDYVDVPKPRSMSPEELREIDRRLQQYRPANRLHKSLEWTGGVVGTCPDFTTVWSEQGNLKNTYCIEIKPKQGWLHEGDRLELRNKCMFCTNQFLKLSRGDISEISGYCPLDLFSGHRKRVEHAIRQLFLSPQNNLKMFMDGVPLDIRGYGLAAGRAFGDDGNQFFEFVTAALLGDFYRPFKLKPTSNKEQENSDEEQENSDKQENSDEDQENLGAEQENSDADQENSDAEQENSDAEESKISTAEKLTTTAVEEPVIIFYTDLDVRPCNFDAIPMSQHSVLYKILMMQKLQNASFTTTCSEYDCLPEATEPFGYIERLVISMIRTDIPLSPVDSYLVAATARDCSVFVTFCKSPSGSDEPDAIQFGDHWYIVNVRVGDLDPKPLLTIEKHRKRNADVLAARNLYFSQK